MEIDKNNNEGQINHKNVQISENSIIATKS